MNPSFANIHYRTTENPFDMDYEMGAIIGSGSFSQVHVGSRRKDNKRVAVKITNSDLFEKDPTWARRLFDEIQILKECRHPNIVEFIDCYQTINKVIIVTEFCEGGDLWYRLTENVTFSEHKIRPLFQQILQAVDYLHSHGIAHRDLKPENLLFRTKEPDSPIVLADFGFARRVGGTGLMKSDVGTPDYAAPEILKQSYSISVDSWALGCILYCMLYGIPPFYSEDSAETLAKLFNGDPIMFYDDCYVSDSAKDLIMKLLDRNPSFRFSVAQAAQHPWVQRGSNHNAILSRANAKAQDQDALRKSLNANIDFEKMEFKEPFAARGVFF